MGWILRRLFSRRVLIMIAPIVWRQIQKRRRK